jgi:dihydrofolate synthase / folylpolyglutamate synthase
MNLESSLKKLFSLHTFGIKLGLDNTINFLNHLGNPQKQLKCIHIAGSNGKGSTSSFIASILQEFSYRIGLYTSPHFVKFNERVVINGKQIDDNYIASFVSENEKYIDDHQLTFFEVTTAMAFQYFKDMKTDYCVIETGLGGRLDATNVLNPLAVVITSISLEHTNVLGDSIEQIANEKAAIIKNGSKVFTGLLKAEAGKVVSEKCAETNSQLFLLNDFIAEKGDSINFLFDDKCIEINSPLKGKYQKYNAALALLTTSKTFNLKEKEKYFSGIERVIVNTGIQGRYEYFNTDPTIIFDSAHNPGGIENFLNEFSNEEKSFKRRTLIFGAMRDKALKEMLQMLSKHFDEILVTDINYERAVKAEELIALCRELNINGRLLSEPAKYIDNFREKDRNECLVVLGSMYLLGEIKQKLLVGVA